jgi:ketosteroid isomerase-like protein
MKKTISTIALSLIVMITFAQSEKTNGTIYVKHPYIDVVNNTVKGYVTQNADLWSACYADSAKFWISGMDMKKWVSKKENLNMLNTDFKFFKDITVKQFGYPDYLAYDEGNDKVVQSWWTWTGTSIKTGKTLKITFVVFDWFNKDGKITKEGTFGDFSKQFAEEGVVF